MIKSLWKIVSRYIYIYICLVGIYVYTRLVGVYIPTKQFSEVGVSFIWNTISYVGIYPGESKTYVDENICIVALFVISKNWK